MKTAIVITELILAAVAVIIFLSVTGYLKKHENEKLSDHKPYLRKLLLALILDGALILALGAVYLVIG